MADAVIPASAAWRHHTARTGAEVVFLHPDGDGVTADGQCCAVEDGRPWSVQYVLRYDAEWVAVSAHVVVHSEGGRAETLLQRLAPGSWLVDGRPAAELEGCLDVDLEASVFTNAAPVHRLGLAADEAADAPAAYVAVTGLGVSRLEQTYRRLPEAGGAVYEYAAPRFGYRGRLVYDSAGLVLNYPGIAERLA
jgi:hypothetical protein